MKYSKSIKTISELKAHASELVRDASANGTSYIITQNGNAKAVLMDIKEYEKQQRKIALLKIVAISEDQVKKGKVTPANEVFSELNKKISKLKKEWNTK
ncbi:MAG: type II toxin-antitoxin system Phd/YefM family antitoxin [Ignavibacteriae bacterium]|nr:MAG: type II toxin-antitoxin system Phd/YefM family antitoxin [Ignavibacteriota bacterium]